MILLHKSKIYILIEARSEEGRSPVVMQRWETTASQWRAEGSRQSWWSTAPDSLIATDSVDSGNTCPVEEGGSSRRSNHNAQTVP